MDVGTAMSVVQTLIAAFQSPELKKLCSIAGYKSQLEELQRTVNFVKVVLEEAEQKHVLSEQEQVYIEDLKDVLYEADDLFDEFVTRAEILKLSKHSITGRFSSVFSKYGLANTMSGKAEKVKAKLANIANNKEFIFKHDPAPIHKIDRETCSYEHEEIIGREDDLKAVKGMLLDPDVDRDVSVLSIVGIGGLGKTALAQLVYNDQKVKDEFSLRMWTCVSDEDQKFNVKGVLCQILDEKIEGSSLEQVQGRLQNKLKEERYLLVLDDVWTENPERWSKLVGCLKEGKRGSWIVVTTRSPKTARLLEHGRVHKLPGLSLENSLRLFKRKAFGSEDSSQPEDLMKIGKVIVEKCAYVPLAIRVVGSLLKGQSKGQWQNFQEYGLANISEEDDVIRPILKISYYQLSYPLKSCFSYCALFCKDEEIKKKKLIQFWMAQGYITSSGLKSMEEVAEDYVLTLIDRGFFQDVNINKGTEIIESFKMHDLMHDLAQQVAKKEICRVGSVEGDKLNKFRHVFLVISKDTKYFAGKTHLRSFLQVSSESIDHSGVDALLRNCNLLRTLDLSWSDIRSLPESIGELLHLRYLDVSGNRRLEVLPRKITRLYNLQVLKLNYCENFKELPKDINRLVNLRVLDNLRCYKSSLMPRRIAEMKSLRTFTGLTKIKGSSIKELFDAMEDLKGLANLKGKLRLSLDICLPMKVPQFEKESGREGGYLMDTKYLKTVSFLLPMVGEKGLEYMVMEELQPHPNLKKLKLTGYRGKRLPRWAMQDNLPNLVTLTLSYCPNLKTLECLGNLSHLSNLNVHFMDNLEFIREKGNTASSSNTTAIYGASPSSTSHGFSFFSSLKELHLYNLPSLKGWEDDSDELRCLPQLEELTILSCPSLAVILHCPLLEKLHLDDFNNRLQIVTEKVMNKKELEDVKGKGKEANISKLKEVFIGEVEWLKFVSIGVNRDKQVKNSEDEFHVCSNSLRNLNISHCKNLTSVSGGPEDLEALKKLNIVGCPNCRSYPET